MSCFCALTLRNFVCTGLPSYDMYLIISYFSYKNVNTILKTEKTALVKRKEMTIWSGFDFCVELSRDDFFDGEVLIEIHSKSTFSSSIIGDVHIAMDDCLSEKSFPVCFVPFTCDGHVRAIDTNLTQDVKYGRCRDGTIERNGKMSFFIGISGQDITKYMLDSDSQFVVAMVIENMYLFLNNVIHAEKPEISDCSAITEYANFEISSRLDALVLKSRKVILILKMLSGYATKDSGFIERHRKLDKDQVFEIDRFIEANSSNFKPLKRSGSFISSPSIPLLKKKEGSFLGIFKK